MIAPLVFALSLGALSDAAQPATFDGYVFGMSVTDAERIAPGRRSFECGRLMTSRCIVYERKLADVAATVTVQFSLDARRIDRIEIEPKNAGDRGGASCETAWTGLTAFLAERFGAPQSREGNTVRWHAPGIEIAATVLQEEGEFCDVSAALTAAQ